MKVRSGWEELVTVAGGVESMSRVLIGSDGGAIFQISATSLAIGFVPQGIGADLIATLVASAAPISTSSPASRSARRRQCVLVQKHTG
ncbi:MAG: hypothetical protein U0Z44_14475 [Kouleothrix sp.]